MDAKRQREWAEYQRYGEWVEMAEMVHDGTMLDEESYYGKIRAPQTNVPTSATLNTLA